MRRGVIPVACLLVSLALSEARARCTVASPATDEIVAYGLLDPSIPVERRRHLADKLLCSALAGNAASQELAGALYLMGRAQRGNVLPRDIPRARHLLTAAAHRGRRQAMQRLAELELGDGHAYEAALWSRVAYRIHGPGRAFPEAGVSPDAQLDAEVALKVQAIREAIHSEASTPP